MLMGQSATKVAGHGPHKHRDPEVLVALGTDPDHPQDLGAEYAIFIGPEMERHVVNKLSLVFTPRQLHSLPLPGHERDSSVPICRSAIFAQGRGNLFP